MAIRPNLFNDSVDILLEHLEFPKSYEGEEYPKYFYDLFRFKYPFIFTDTNPLLYRKFSKYLEN